MESQKTVVKYAKGRPKNGGKYSKGKLENGGER